MKKLGISIAIFGIVVLLTVATIATNRPQIQEQKSYIISKTFTFESLTVWLTNDSLTTINQTTSTWLVFFNVTYNETTREIHEDILDKWLLKYITNQVFQSENTSYAIQWAINNGDRIEFAKGCYKITNTIILDSNTTLDGNGSKFTLSENFPYPVFLTENVTNVAISNCWIDDTK